MWDSIFRRLKIETRRTKCIDCNKNINPQFKKGVMRCKSCNMLGNRNYQWKGNKVGLPALHEWVRNHKRKPKLCIRCRKKPPYDVANISGKYKRDVKDFEWVCRYCHMKNDGRLKQLMIDHKNWRKNEGHSSKKKS